MAVLQRMRDKFGVLISVIIALSLLYFIAPMDDIMTLFGSGNNLVGEIAGKKITYDDFQAEVNKFTTVNEITTGSSVQNEETQEQIRNSAWQEFVDRYLFVRTAKDAGFRVGEQEMVELTTGNKASAILSRNPIFADKNGNFNPQSVVEFVKNIEADETGRLKTYWNYIQGAVYSQQYYAKYGFVFTHSNIENALMVKNDVAMNNTTANADYVFTPFGYERDTTIVISKAAIQKYYKENKKNFKQTDSRDVRYVVFEVVPSAKDIAEVNDNMASAYEDFKSAENLKTFLLKNSERQLSEYWYKKGELANVSSALSEFVDNAKVGEFSEICVEGNSFFAAKVIATASRSESVQARIIPADGAKEITDSLLTALRLSQEMELTQSRMVPGCESLIEAKIGEPQLVQSRVYGTLLAEVVSKSAPETMKQVAILEKTALASKNTFNDYYSKANTFAVLTAGTVEGYNKAVDSLKVYSRMMNITEGTDTYGSVENAKEITRWAFEAKKGKASNIITVNNNFFFVVALDAIHKEGYKPVAEVSGQIKELLYDKEFKVKRTAEVKNQIAGLQTLDEIAEKLGASISASQEINFSSMGGSLDPAVLGAMYAAPETTVCGPVQASNGIYVFKVNSKQASEFYTAEDAKSLQDQKNNYATQFLIPAMSDNLGVVDNRARFF